MSSAIGFLSFLAATQIEMPLLVTLTRSDRNALLLCGSSQEAVPGTKFEANSLTHSNALMVSGC
jgi:hypothetical protein